jgi:ribonuclease HI
MSALTVHTDGGARGNPGPAATGIVLTFADGTQQTAGEYLGEATNNVAEYRGLLTGIHMAIEAVTRDAEITTVTFYLDSELVVRQMQGVYRVKDATLQVLHREATQALTGLGARFAFAHVPRAQNKQADSLVNATLDATK